MEVGDEAQLRVRHSRRFCYAERLRNPERRIDAWRAFTVISARVSQEAVMQLAEAPGMVEVTHFSAWHPAVSNILAISASGRGNVAVTA